MAFLHSLSTVVRKAIIGVKPAIKSFEIGLASAPIISTDTDYYRLF